MILYYDSSDQLYQILNINLEIVSNHNYFNHACYNQTGKLYAK